MTSEKTRVGSGCWYRLGCMPCFKWMPGTILAWSTDNDGDGTPFPVAIIEDHKTGTVKCVYPYDNISFAAVPPGQVDNWE